MSFREQAISAEQQGQLPQALENLLAWASAQPKEAEPWLQAGRVLEKLNNIPDAIMAYEQVLLRQPTSLDARKRLGPLYYQNRQFPKALSQYQYLLQHAPVDADLMYGTSTVLIAMSELEAARKLLLKARDRFPDVALIWSNLALTLKMMGMMDNARLCFEKALALQEMPVVRVRYAFLLIDCGLWDEARVQFLQLQASRPIDAAIGLAALHERHGEIAEGLALLEPHVGEASRYPTMGPIYARLCLAMRQPDKALPLLEDQLKTPLGNIDRGIYLHFLATVQDARGQYPEAFAAWKESHRLRNLGYHADAIAQHIEDIKRVFSGSFWENARVVLGEAPVLDTTPIFLVGMPRSGTSLTEQILACHPDVYPAGELENLRQIASSLGNSTQLPFPACFGHLDRLQEHWPAASAIQHAFWARSSAGYRVMTDKMPNNTLLVGLAAVLFPNARVIWCRRDPMDAGLSCFQQNFASQFGWAHRLEDIAQWWLFQEGLLAHWKKHLPLPIYEVNYEQLVSHPSEEIPRLVEFCGLPWHEACLHPEKNARAVKTASYEQVRHPISPRSVGRWHRYEAELAPMQAVIRKGLSG